MICHTLCHALRHAHYFTFRLLWHKASCVIVWETHCGSHKTRVKICFWTPLGHDFDTSLRLATPRYARIPQIASLCIKIKTFWGPKTDFHTCLNGNHSLLAILWHNNHCKHEHYIRLKDFWESNALAFYLVLKKLGKTPKSPIENARNRCSKLKSFTLYKYSKNVVYISPGRT